jgi:FkbM family methyltransferase
MVDRIEINNIENRHFDFKSLIDNMVDIKIYSKKLKQEFYSTTMFIKKNNNYFISHPSLLNLREVNIDFKFQDKTITMDLKDELRSQENHILNYYTEEEYNVIEPFINWTYTEVIVDDHYGISKLEQKFYEDIKVVVDLGANIGTFGKFISKKCRNVESYICVEPFAELKGVIEEHTKELNPMVYTRAFDSENKTIPFIANDNILESAKNFTDNFDNVSLDNTDVTEIKTITLKDIFDNNNGKIIDLLKVDIEGAETHLLKGDNLIHIRGVRYLIIEAHSDEIKNDIISKLNTFEVVNINNPGLPHIFMRNTLLTDRKPTNLKKILVKVSCPAMGDILCSTPTIRKVSESYGQKIDVMTKRFDLFENNPYINNILDHTEEDPDGYDEVFETYNQHYKLNKNMGNEEFYDKPMEVKLSNFEARQLHAMGVGITLYPDEMSYDYIANGQTEISEQVDDNYIVLHVTENWPSRTWSIKKWQELVDLIKSKTNYKIVTIGKAHQEDGYFGKIDKGVISLNNIDLDTCLYDNVGRQDHVQLGEGSLSELWHIINNSKALISFDAGPVHLAGTTDTHIIQIGSSIRYEKTAPYRNGTQNYKYDFVGGTGCTLFCASDPKYSVKEWGTINSMPYYPECQEKFTEFKCQPTVKQVFERVKKL